MALFYECIQECCSKPIDAADIVREAILQQSSLLAIDKVRPQHWHSVWGRVELPD